MEKECVDTIKKRALEIQSEYDDLTDPIRDDIFKMIRKKGNLVFYPLEQEEDLDGFHVDRVINGQIVPFVYINTAKYWDKCIFCAAHELGHIYEIEKDVLKKCPGIALDDTVCDAIMNRFAAELLMPEKKVIKRLKSCLGEIGKRGDDIREKDILKLVIKLMDYFFTPYKAVVIRLYEIGFLTEMGMEHYLEYNNAVIESFILEGNYIRPRQKTHLKQMDNLEDMIRKTQGKRIISQKAVDEICSDFEIELAEEIDKYEEMTAEKKLESKLVNSGGVC